MLYTVYVIVSAHEDGCINDDFLSIKRCFIRIFLTWIASLMEEERRMYSLRIGFLYEMCFLKDYEEEEED